MQLQKNLKLKKKQIVTFKNPAFAEINSYLFFFGGSSDETGNFFFKNIRF